MIRKRQPRRAAPPPAASPPDPAATRPRRPLRRRTRPLAVPAALPAIGEHLEARAVIPAPLALVPAPLFTSQINPSYPVHGTPTTQSVRDNFQFAKQEIEALYGAGGGIPDDAPNDGKAYGRQSANWAQVIAATGDVVDGGNF